MTSAYKRLIWITIKALLIRGKCNIDLFLLLLGAFVLMLGAAMAIITIENTF